MLIIWWFMMLAANNSVAGGRVWGGKWSGDFRGRTFWPSQSNMSVMRNIFVGYSTQLCKRLSFVPRRNLFQWLMYNPKKGVDRDWLAYLQQPIDLSAVGIARWLNKKEWEALKEDQRFIQERHDKLGPDLATSHFIVKRGGAVKFVNSNRWIEKDKDGNYKLPDRMVPNFILEAVDASNTDIMFESFDNFIKLRHLQYLNLSKCKYIDDWCMDRLQQFKDTLICLDVSGCPQVTERGLAALHKVPTLRCLRAYDMPKIQDQKLLKLMLEEMMPLCTVEGLDKDNIEATAPDKNEIQSAS